MPAVSEQPPRLPHTWRPFGARIAGIVFGGLLLAVCAFAWFTFDEATRATFTLFQRGTLVFVGLLAFFAWYALVRSRVVADERTLVVVNGYRKREYEWAEIVGVHLPPGAPWATLDLSDGSTATALAIQGSDGERARRAVRDLRVLADRAHRAE